MSEIKENKLVNASTNCRPSNFKLKSTNVILISHCYLNLISLPNCERTRVDYNKSSRIEPGNQNGEGMKGIDYSSLIHQPSALGYLKYLVLLQTRDDLVLEFEFTYKIN